MAVRHTPVLLGNVIAIKPSLPIDVTRLPAVNVGLTKRPLQVDALRQPVVNAMASKPSGTADVSKLPVVTVACVGDSLTKSGYPEDLQDVLKSSAVGNVRWRVMNFGVNGATACVPSGAPQVGYGRTPQFRQALECGANIVAVLLGTNDAHQAYWDQVGFVNGLVSIVQQLMTSRDPPPEVLLAVPPPLYHSNHQLSERLQRPVINDVFPKIIPQLAEQLGVGIIDAFSALGGSSLSLPGAYLFDGYHLNSKGRRLLAEAVAREIFRLSARKIDPPIATEPKVEDEENMEECTPACPLM